MTTHSSTERGRHAPEHPTGSALANTVGGVRSDLNTILLPLFSEQPEATSARVEIDGVVLSMHTDDEGVRLPTTLDWKILNLLSAHVRDAIRLSGRPTRHITVWRQDLLDLMKRHNGAAGGADYKRLTDRLQRLLSVRIVAERRLDGSTSRRRHFRWIDAFEEDLRETGRGKELVKIKISLSEDAFAWITRHQGFDMSHQEHLALSSSSASISRIFSIALAKLVSSQGCPVFMQIDDLRRRIPLNSELKSFKAKTLKTAIKQIAANPSMSRLLSLELCRTTDDGFVPLAGRTPLDQIYLKIKKGPGDLPSVDCLLPDGHSIAQAALLPGRAFAALTASVDIQDAATRREDAMPPDP